ncbi:MAG TPA: 50S ribosomal protein L20 [Candidatus Ozemobacteraceae bacterium]|nr:50S ribosomal protein L20 [Candidatus Ozemobacteraceae bacterium]
MPRSKSSSNSRRKDKKVFRLAKGFWGGRRKVKKTAKEAVLNALWHAYNHRRDRKQDMRSLWIVRINAACRTHEISYSRFMDGLKKSGIALNRKVLAEMAVNDPEAFKSVVSVAKAKAA